MIQRKQTLWLLIVAVAAFLTLKFPFYTGNILENNSSVFKELNAGTYGNMLITILSVTIGILALVSIFLYNIRQKQILLCIINLIISIAVIILYYLQAKKFTDGTFSITAIFSIIIPVLLVMAIVGIYKDEKLIKSANSNRLR